MQNFGGSMDTGGLETYVFCELRVPVLILEPKGRKILPRNSVKNGKK
jgi:hypothetical protein